MSVRDFGLLTLICLLWGFNLVLTRAVVLDVPPLFYAALRFAVIALVLMPLLLPVPKQWGRVIAVGMCVGALNFVLLFLALQQGTASSVAIAGQLGLPFTTILSMLFLGEKVGWRRGLGMGLAFAGVVLIAYDPRTFGFSLGVILSALCALIGSIGGILMKRMEPLAPLRMQGWIGLVSVPLPLVLTLTLEHGQWAGVAAFGWPAFLLALLFSVFAVSMFGHGQFYSLWQRYDATLLSPLTLMTPVFAVILGVVLLHERFTAQMWVGAAIALFGVGLVAVRPNLRLPDAAALWRRGGQ